MSKLFIFTIRDVREDSVSKYNGLIPKLYGALYNDPSMTIDRVLNYDKVMKSHTHESLFELILKHKGSKNYPNILHTSKYLSKRDKENIIKLTMGFYKEEDLKNKDKYLQFIEHIFKAHSTMQYGIYFGMRKADSEKDFLDSIQGTRPTSKNQSIIYYTNIENVLDYVDKVSGKVKYDNPLLYFNKGWQYGLKEEDSKDYDNNKYDFICHIRSYPNYELETSETICKVPLPRDLFKHTYKNIHDDAFKKFN